MIIFPFRVGGDCYLYFKLLIFFMLSFTGGSHIGV